MNTRTDNELLIRGLIMRINRSLALEEMARAQKDAQEAAYQISKRIGLRVELCKALEP